MNLTQGVHREKAFVTFHDTFSMKMLHTVEADLIKWGARDVLKKYTDFKIILLELEINVTVDGFASKALGHPDILYVEPVPPLKLATEIRVFHDKALAAWHLDSLRCKVAHGYTKGFGARVALIDTGIGYHPELPSTDLAKARELLLEDPAFWNGGVAKEILFQAWQLTTDQRFLYSSALGKFKQYANSYGRLGQLSSFKHLQTEVFEQRRRKPLISYPQGCPAGIENASAIEDVTLDELRQYSGLPDVIKATASNDFQAIEQVVAPAILRDVFDADYPRTILRDYFAEFRWQSGFPLLHKVMYESRVWLDDLVYRTIAFESASFVSGDDSLFDYDGHGTAVAGVFASSAFGIAPESELIILKVCSDGKSGADTSNLLDAIAHAISIKADVIHFGVLIDTPVGHTVIQAVERACEHAYQKNILMIAPVGNQGDNKIPLPASLDAVVAVSSFTPDLQRSSFSNYGQKVELCAYGGGTANPAAIQENIYRRWDKHTDILSTRIGGGYEMGTGTSYASAQVAAAAALLRARNSNLDGDSLRKRLQQCVDSHFLIVRPRSIEAGYGLLNLAKI